MTLANRITIMRAFLSMVVFACILINGTAFKLLALFFFVLAAVSDWLDGKIARETNTVTPFGAIADPFVDKLLIGGAFIAFASVKQFSVPLWAVFIIIARELMVSSLRVLAALSGKVLAAEPSGKFKTVFQMTGAIMILVILNIHSIVRSGQGGSLTPALERLHSLVLPLPYGITVVVSLVTLASGVSYISNHWKLLQDSWSQQRK
ncbi:MAG: CDP-diacylglycerol--glycerol-3-phosphate 3-phosphatidyltransferase [Elusimicrobiales bacterium]